jgi:hypothetical protein
VLLHLFVVDCLEGTVEVIRTRWWFSGPFRHDIYRVYGGEEEFGRMRRVSVFVKVVGVDNV